MKIVGNSVIDWRGLNKLEPQERHIVRLLHGIPYGDHTLDEVGAIFDLTRERIRQIQMNVIRRIKNSQSKAAVIQRRRLRDFWED